MHIGITAYGLSIPRYRLAVEETWRVWRNAMLNLLKHQIFVSERAVTGPGQNAVTLGVEAAQRALQHAAIDAAEIDALIMGTCTNPDPYHPLGIFKSDMPWSGPDGLKTYWRSAATPSTG
jgi:3-hydroxy-3-methylglutaryl CoA synthase